jgi:hypothetical protein
MSSAVSGVGQGLYQFFQSVSNSASTPAASAAGANSTASTGQQVSGHHHHHHHGGGDGGAMFQQLQSAVSGALQSAQGNSSADPNQIIQDAIEKVMKNAGAGGANAASGALAQASGSDPDGNGDSDAPGKANNDGGAKNQAFVQMLQSYGVSPQQFHQDFLAAIKDAQQNSNTDPRTALQSFPPGSAVDTQG